MNKFQPPARVHLHAQVIRAWKEGLIICSGQYNPELFISEIDQMATKYHVDVEIKRMGGKAYCLANKGIPLSLKSRNGEEHYRQHSLNYRITQSAWGRIMEGLGLGD